METIRAERRATTEKAKQLRRKGIVPCVIDGTSLEQSIPVQLDLKTAKQIRQTKRIGSKADIEVDGKSYHTLIKDLEYSCINDTVVHISFHILDAGKKIGSVADIVLLNKEKVAGVLEQLQMQIPHAAEPQYLLDTVTVDLAGLTAGTVITVKDIPEFQNENIELQTDPDSIVVRITDKKRAAAYEPAAEAAAE